MPAYVTDPPHTMAPPRATIPNLFQGFLQGYPGPMPGTPEFQAARAAGQHPILDWLRSQRAAGQSPFGFGFGANTRPPGAQSGQGIAIGEPNGAAPAGLAAPAPPSAAAAYGAGMAPLGEDAQRRPPRIATQLGEDTRRPTPLVRR